MEAGTLEFGRYVLDLNRGSLSLDGREIALTPNPFAVLRYLAEHPDRVVSSDELLAAVWPDPLVTEDTLAQTISELRRALGETGARLIITEPTGYRFEPNAGPPDRRRPRHPHFLRWRWMYGILAPLALLFTLLILWLGMRGRW